MALTQQQELDIARQRIAQGQGSEIDKQNVAFADQQQTTPQEKTYLDYVNEAYDNPQYNDAVSNLNALQAQEPGYLQKEAARLRSEDPYIQSILEEKKRIQSNLGATGELYDKYSDVFDPIKRNALISREISNMTANLGYQGDVLEQRGGTLDQQAQLAYDMFESKLGSAQNQVSELGGLLKSVGEKNYDQAISELERQRDLEDYFKKYTGKLEIDRALRINDFAPSDTKTYTGTWTDRYSGQTYKYITDTNGNSNYIPIGTANPTDYTGWIANKSSELGMSIDPNSPDWRATFDAEQKQSTELIDDQTKLTLDSTAQQANIAIQQGDTDYETEINEINADQTIPQDLKNYLISKIKI